MIGRIILVVLAITAIGLPANGANRCRLSSADKAANATLSFDDFDQVGALPSTARKLVERGCYDAAVEANEEYLLFGKVMGEGERRVVSFHLGQALALAGRGREAARVIAGTLKPDQPADAELDWNTYVKGVWAFLIKDRVRLDAAQRVLSTLGGNNPINAGALARLQTCFKQSYKAAMNDPACAPK